MSKRYGMIALSVLGFFLLSAAMLQAKPGVAKRKNHALRKSGSSLKAPTAKRKPKRQVAGPIHVVKQGDTLYEIARANQFNVRKLKELNHLRNTRLRIGQRLLLAPPGTTARSKEKESSVEMVTAAVKTEALEEDSTATPSVSAKEKLQSASDLLTPAAKDSETQGQPTMRNQLVQAGMDFLGVPYRWRGISENRGVDCSGLVKNIFDQFNIELPHSAREQFKLGEKVAKTELEIGDLVFFTTRGKIPTHVGIYIGNNQFLHAARRARQVIISNLSQSWYQKRFLGARRISDLWRDEQKPPEAKGN